MWKKENGYLIYGGQSKLSYHKFKMLTKIYGFSEEQILSYMKSEYEEELQRIRQERLESLLGEDIQNKE
jgi:hypothetical protein